MQKLAKLVTEINNKMNEFKIYNKTVKNLINGNKWEKTINKEL